MILKDFDQLIDLINMKISNAIKDVLDHTDDIDKLNEAELEAQLRETLTGETTNGENKQS